MSLDSIYPSISSILGLPNDYAEDISSQTFYAFVIAYNDQITRKKREVCLNKNNQKIYQLSSNEKAGLEVAFKAGRDGNTSDEDVNKLFSSFCSNEVSSILSSKGNYAKKLQALHALAVDKASQKEGAGSYSCYSKLIDIAEKYGNNVRKNNFHKECEVLDTYSEYLGSNEKFKKITAGKNGEEIKKIKDELEDECSSSLERMFYFILPSVRCAVSFDACLNCIKNQNQGVSDSQSA